MGRNANDVERVGQVRGTLRSIVRQRRRHDSLDANAVRHHGHTLVVISIECMFLIRCACAMCA
eukprot:6156071-Pyramimonas_sp.AAC.1